MKIPARAFVWALIGLLHVAPLDTRATETGVGVKFEDPTHAPTTTEPARDQVVLLSTRSLTSRPGHLLDQAGFSGVEYSPSGTITGNSVCLLSNPYPATWIFVHGNQIPADAAVERGIRVYQSLRRCRTSDVPIRFIIWSWPSQRTTGRIADARLKARRTDAEAFYLGHFLAATATTSSPTSIIAYSFGARIVGGALHLNEGGQVEGYCLPRPRRPSAPYRVAYLAAASDRDGLTSSGRASRALNNVDRLLLENNSSDIALRFYWVMSSRKPLALGASGLRSAPPHCRVQQCDWAKVIGKDHSLWQYMDRPSVVGQILDTVDRTKS